LLLARADAVDTFTLVAQWIGGLVILLIILAVIVTFISLVFQRYKYEGKTAKAWLSVGGIVAVILGITFATTLLLNDVKQTADRRERVRVCVAEARRELLAIEIAGSHANPEAYRARGVALVNRTKLKAHQPRLNAETNAAYYHLPESLWPDDKDACQTIVWLDWDVTQTGQYRTDEFLSSGEPVPVFGYVLSCVATIVDRSSNTRVARKTFRGEDPPDKVGQGSPSKVYGQFSAEDLAKWISDFDG
jgi:hypothetical protein